MYIPNSYPVRETLYGSLVCMQLHRAQLQRADGTQIKSVGRVHGCFDMRATQIAPGDGFVGMDGWMDVYVSNQLKIV